METAHVGLSHQYIDIHRKMDNSSPLQSTNNATIMKAFKNISEALVLGRSDGGGGHEPFSTGGGGHEPFPTGGGGHEPFPADLEAPSWFCEEDGRQGIHIMEMVMNYTLVFFIMVMEKFLIHRYRTSQNRFARIVCSEWTARLLAAVIVALAITFTEWSFDCPQRVGHEHTLEKAALASRIAVDGAILLADSLWAVGRKLFNMYHGIPELRAGSIKALLAEEKYEEVSELNISTSHNLTDVKHTLAMRSKTERRGESFSTSEILADL